MKRMTYMKTHVKGENNTNIKTNRTTTEVDTFDSHQCYTAGDSNTL